MFAIVLILFGAITSYDIISVFGLFLLIPAFLIPSQQPSQRRVDQKKEEPRRSSLATPPTVAPVVSAPSAAMEVPYVPMSSQPSASAALFPNTMFPTLSLTPQTPRPIGEARHVATEPRDELLEFGLLLAILRAVAG